MKPVWRFPDQDAFRRAKVVQTINEHVGQDGGQTVRNEGDPRAREVEAIAAPDNART